MFRHKEIVVDEFYGVDAVLIAKPEYFLRNGSGGFSTPSAFIDRGNGTKPTQERATKTRVIRNRPRSEASLADVTPHVHAMVRQLRILRGGERGIFDASRGFRMALEPVYQL